jgi:HAD superfamily hydrolase (TIGR01509 family)
MEMPLPAAVVFDNDGLLFERRGIDFTPVHKRELVGTSAEIAGGILERRLDEPGRASELIEELNELVVAELEHGVEAMVGASELLHQLKCRGTPIGLVSNSPLAFVRRSLEIVGFAAHFDVVLSAHEVAAPKPAPDPYLEACRRLGVEPGPSVVALEDSPTGVAAARAAGLTVIGVPSLEGIELEEAHEIAESLLDTVVARRLVL